MILYEIVFDKKKKSNFLSASILNILNCTHTMALRNIIRIVFYILCYLTLHNNWTLNLNYYVYALLNTPDALINY